MPTLTKEQLNLAAYLAEGMTQTEAAVKAGVSRSTVWRFMKMADFQAEVERRRNKGLDLHRVKQEEKQFQEVSEFYSDLQKYRESLLQIHKSQIGLGGSILKKMNDRFKDLPIESFTPKDLPGMFNVANNLLKDGFSGWAELIGLDEVLRRLEQDGTEERS